MEARVRAQEDDDVRLMLAFRDGDVSAFDTLFARWAGRLLRYLERMVRDAACAEELAQEVFVRVFRARESYRPEARFSTWLYTIATRVALNELRRPRRRSPHESADGEAAPVLVAGSPEPDRVVDAQRTGRAVEEALAELPERQRSALWLAAVEGLSYAEVAESLGTTPKSVKALVHRARVSLARSLPPPEGCGDAALEATEEEDR
jgi:RNA polymerase sigma-70 factor (ECF subfamily)